MRCKNGAVAPTELPLPRRRRQPWYVAGTFGLLLAAGAFGVVAFLQDRHPAAPLPERSIAVLPFVAMSDDAPVRHLANALVEELLNDLAAQRQLKVASRTASATKPAAQSVRDYAAALGVFYVLEGSVRPASDGFHVTVQLIRARDELHLLSQTLDLGRDNADMEGLARQIAFQAFRYIDQDVRIAAARSEEHTS